MAKIENPFDRNLKRNRLLAALLAVVLISIPVGYEFLTHSFTTYYQEKIKENQELKAKEAAKAQELQKLKDELKLKEDKLKKLSVTKKIISDFIAKHNSSLNGMQVEAYASKIMRESSKRGHSPYIQAALLASESSFKSNPTHAIRTVYGMGGIYADVWAKDLKRCGIIDCNKDLLNPYKNIESSAYVLSYYMGRSDRPFTALAKYKGYSALGKSQAASVMKVAVSLKMKEKSFIS